MKRIPRLETIITQFNYDHKEISRHLKKIHKSADELSKFLNGMPPQKGKKDEGEKEIKK
ncbi:MAG: hypothetical protein Q4C91_11325 [Eubacteriales bacterium]|nr:hypothetical protein [Eubacteriales bacterium]